ncbi:MAG: NifU family protein [Ginsengibacter sp.]
MSIFSKDDLEAVQDVINNTTGSGKKKVSAEEEEVTELNRKSERIQDLLEQIDLLPDDHAKSMMQECMQETLSFYGHGLERILNIIVSGNSAAATELLNKLIEDNFVNGLLLIHDLHPLDLQTRLHMALDKVRPYMDTHGGSVEIIDLTDGIATLKLAGNCKGCPSSASTLEFGIKQAIEEHCPDLLELKIEGGSMSSLAINGNDTRHTATRWEKVTGTHNLENGDMRSKNIEGNFIIFCKVSDNLYAYRDFCPACELPLHSGKLEGKVLSCRMGHQYNVQLAGRCIDNEELHLEPFPLTNENGELRISVG